MSVQGQKRTFGNLRRMSALPPKADIAESDWDVRFVPKADIRAHSITEVPITKFLQVKAAPTIVGGFDG